MKATILACEKCGGSGKNPPGRPEVYIDQWGRPVFVGFSWTMSSTQPLPNCLACNGSGRAHQ